MSRRSEERRRLAEEFLRVAPSPRTPRTLREYGFQRIVARASGARAEERKAARRPALLLRTVAVLLLSVLLLAGATSGLYAASAGALPSSTLYGCKIFFERARLAFTFSSASEAGLEMGYCERRMRELREMVGTVDSPDWERWLREYLRNLARAEELLDAVSGPDSASLSRRFEAILEEQAGLLEEVSTSAPEEGRPYLEEAYRECRAGRERIRRRCGMESGPAHPMDEQEMPGEGKDGDSRCGMDSPGAGGAAGSTGIGDGEPASPSGSGGEYDDILAPPVQEGGSTGSTWVPEGSRWPGEHEAAREGENGPAHGRHVSFWATCTTRPA